MSKDIYQILESLDAAQKSVKQLPALFKPKETSPQLSGPYPGRNATLGYLVGEGEEGNAMRNAVTRRIVNQHPEWIVKYGVEALMQAIDDVTEGEEDWEEIGSSDVSAYVHRVKDHLDDRMGSREEMDDRKPFAEETQDKEKYNQLAAELNAARKAGDMAKAKEIGDELMKLGGGSFEIDIHGQAKPVNEAQTTEDVISTVKKKLGDYLSDLSKEIKKDPDLKDKLERDIDQIGPAVKTIKTDDGHEIKIHGNEDDGFRITIKNKEAKTKFDNLDEAVMACEMYCARRRMTETNNDYVEEKRS